MSEINVKAVKMVDRRYWRMYYDCPLSGKRFSRSTRKTNRREAERAAAKWEAELREGRYRPGSRVTWQEFRERYETEVLTTMAERTDEMLLTVFNAVERICSPQKLGQLTAERLSHFQSVLRREDIVEDGEKKAVVRSDATVRGYLAHLKSALAWAVDMDLLPAVPKVKMPQRARQSKVMKGRPITTEEFERMLAACEKVRPQDFADWQTYLAGLWLSGLRLRESLALTWGSGAFTVDFTVRRPCFRILAEAQKAGRDEVVPMTPDFAAWLERTPTGDRTGRVFPIRLSHKRASRVISAIGKRANVVVENEGRVKYASAHDLRRSFGTRWASRVMPAVLKRLMRHASIDTTMLYYVDLDAGDIADRLWEAHGGVTTFVTSRAESADGAATEDREDAAQVTTGESF